MLAGELKVVTSSDLGGLGAREGPPVSLVWTVPNLWPVLLPWLAVLALLALPSNRNARAWLVWVPLTGMALLGTGLAASCKLPAEQELSYFAHAGRAASFGLAATWLLGAALSRRCRALSIVLAALASAAVSLLAFVVSPAWEVVWDWGGWDGRLLFPLLFLAGGGLALAGALNLTGWRYRKRFGLVRVSLRLPLGLWVMWIVVFALIGCGLTLVPDEDFYWPGALLVGPIALSLVSFALILPFLILSFTSAFYRERFRDLLRLPAESAVPSTPVSTSVIEQGISC
jgi:hypothetical protein